MRTFLLIVALAALSASSAQAEQSRERKPDKPAVSIPLRPAKTAVNPCAEYGAGFVRVDGSSTCVKIGGTISVGAGGTR
jgi:hypothetical protein